MKPTAAISILLVSCASTVVANDALDILEGNKKVTDTANPVPVETTTADGKPAKPKGKLTYEELAVPAWQTETFDPVWARAVLFEDDANPWVQYVAIKGFFQYEFASGNAEVDAVGATPAKKVDLDHAQTRRARLGARVAAFHNTTIEANGEFAGDSGYNRIERLVARTAVLPAVGVTYGKFRPDFSGTGRAEPQDMPIPERSMLTHMLLPAETLGLRVDGTWRDWDAAIGWHSGDTDRWIPGFSGDGLLSLNIGHTFIEESGDTTMRTRWYLDYMHNFDAGNGGGAQPRYGIAGRASANGDQLVAANPSFRNLISTGFTIEQGRFSMLADFTLAKGETSVWGTTIQPSYWAIPGYLEIVGRYHYASTDDPGALVSTMGWSADPFRDSSPFFIGDEYHSFYLGANAHLYQDRLLFTSGVENVILKDENGAGFNTEAWIWHAGMQTSF